MNHIAKNIQDKTLRKKVSLFSILVFLFLKANIIVIPIKKIIIPVEANILQLLCPLNKSTKAGSIIMQPRVEIKSPIIYKTDLKFIFSYYTLTDT